MFNYSQQAGLNCHLIRNFSNFSTFTEVFVALNIASSITATLGNALILIALQKESTLNPPSKLFLRCMAFSDLSVGLLAQPAVVISFLFAVYQRWDLCLISEYISFFFNAVFPGFSCATITIVSVDRHLALLLRNRYRQVVTIKRARIVVLLFLFASTANCFIVLISTNVFIIFNFIMWSSWILLSIYCYMRIFLTLKIHIRAQITPQGQPNGISPENLLRYRKTVSTVLWLFAAMIICYFPVALVFIAHSATSQTISSMMIFYFAISLVHFNSSLNPLLYCWKIREIRNAVKEILRNLA